MKSFRSECGLKINKDFERDYGISFFTFESQTCVTLSKSKVSNEIQQLWWNEVDAVNHCDCICYKSYIVPTFGFFFITASFVFFITAIHCIYRLYGLVRNECRTVE